MWWRPALCLFVVGTAFAFSHAQSATATPHESWGHPRLNDCSRLDLRGADVLDVVAIVRLIADAGSDVRPMLIGDELKSSPCEKYTVEIIDSTTLPAGARLTAVMPVSPTLKAYHFKVGETFLLGGTTQAEGRLHFPDWFGDFDDLGHLRAGTIHEDRTPAAGKDEIGLLMFLPTKATHLPEASTPGYRLGIAVLECLPGSSEEQLPFTMWAAYQMIGPMVGNMAIHTAGDDEYTLALRRVAGTLDPYYRMRLLYLLIWSRIPGSEEPFVQAVLEASKSPHRFGPSEESLIGESLYDFKPSWDKSQPPDFKPDANRFIEMAVDAGQPIAKRFFIAHLGGASPDESHLRMLASLLNDPDRKVQLQVLEFFGRRSGDRAKTPTIDYTRYVCDDGEFDRLLDYWKKQFGVTA